MHRETIHNDNNNDMADRIIIHSLEKVVSKESAIKLREMGFNQFCDCYYHTDNDDPYDYEMGNNQLNNDNFEDYHERCSAPYVNQALLWLMHTYGIALEVKTYYNKKSETGFEYSVKIKFGEDSYFQISDIDYQTALHHALHNLLVGTCISEPEKRAQFYFIQKED